MRLHLLAGPPDGTKLLASEQLQLIAPMGGIRLRSVPVVQQDPGPWGIGELHRRDVGVAPCRLETPIFRPGKPQYLEDAQATPSAVGRQIPPRVSQSVHLPPRHIQRAEFIDNLSRRPLQHLHGSFRIRQSVGRLERSILLPGGGERSVAGNRGPLLEEQSASAIRIGLAIPRRQHRSRLPGQIASVFLSSRKQIVKDTVRQFHPGRMLVLNQFFEGDLLILDQHTHRPLGSESYPFRGGHIGRKVIGIEHHRERRRPGRIVGILHPSARGIDHPRQIAVRIGLRPQVLGRIPRDNALPVLPVSLGSPGYTSSEEIHNVTVPVRIDHVEERHLQPTQRSLELVQIGCAHHVPILLEDMGLIQAHQPYRKSPVLLHRHHRTMQGAAYHEGLLTQRAVVLLDPQRMRLRLKGPYVSVPPVPALHQLEFVQIHPIQRVHRMGPPQVLVEGNGQCGYPNQRHPVST